MKNKSIMAIIEWLKKYGDKNGDGTFSFVCHDEPFMAMATEWQPSHNWLWLDYNTIENGDYCADPRFIFKLNEEFEIENFIYENGLAGVSTECEKDDNYPLEFAKLIYKRHLLPRQKEVQCTTTQ